MSVVTVREICDFCLGEGTEEYYIDGSFEPTDCWECNGSGYRYTTKKKEVSDDDEKPERYDYRERICI